MFIRYSFSKPKLPDLQIKSRPSGRRPNLMLRRWLLGGVESKKESAHELHAASVRCGGAPSSFDPQGTRAARISAFIALWAGHSTYMFDLGFGLCLSL